MFSNDNTTGKLNIRSLPLQVLSALSDLAARNDRSLEAEARHALKEWVKPVVAAEIESTRLSQLSNRLQSLAKDLEIARPSKPCTPSRMAEALGMTHAVPVEQWFLGQTEPSFADLSSIARVTGCHIDWLSHGEGTPFSSKYERIPEHAIFGTEFLLTPREDGLRPYLHLVRSKDRTGSFLFVRQYSDWDYRVFNTPYHVSEVIGAGGESSLAALSLVLKGVYRALTQHNPGFEVFGYLMEKDEFAKLIEGARHPAILLKSAEESCWWEDFWDASQFDKQDYWEGWNSITRHIYKVVEDSPHLREQKATLAAHRFEFSKQAPIS